MVDALKQLGNEFIFTENYSGTGNDLSEQYESGVQHFLQHYSPYTLDDIIRITIFLENIRRDFGLMNSQHEKTFPDYKPTRVACQPVKMPLEGSLIGFKSVVYMGDEELEFITTGTPTVGPYTPGIKVGKYFLTSGQIRNINPQTRLVEGDSGTQLIDILNKSKVLLYNANFKVNDVMLIDYLYTNPDDEILKNIIRRDHPEAEIVPQLVSALPANAKVELVYAAMKR